MTDLNGRRGAAGAVRIRSFLSDDDHDVQLRDDVRRGLTAAPKSLPPKWFYDKVGSELFDQITRLPEYYPTEAERRILVDAADEIVELADADSLAELGSGSSDKTRVLLDAMERGGRLSAYLPLDVSETALIDAARVLRERYPNLVVDGVVGDFDRHLGEVPRRGRRMVAFLGGTIGNYPPVARRDLLASIARMLAPGETFLVGTDLVKAPERLIAAYDDSAGVTAAFNRNVLDVVNRELGADFDPDAFDHVAVWNAEEAWIEMRLRARSRQRVTVPALDLMVEFADGEDLLTEISAKFTLDGLAAELADVGLDVVGSWTDPPGDFALTLARRGVHGS